MRACRPYALLVIVCIHLSSCSLNDPKKESERKINGFADSHIKGKYAQKQFEQAMSFVKKQDIKSAKRCLMKADSADPHNPYTLAELGNMAGLLESYDSANDYFRQSIQVDSLYFPGYLLY